MSLGPGGFPPEARRGQPKPSLHCPSRSWSLWGKKFGGRAEGTVAGGSKALGQRSSAPNRHSASHGGIREEGNAQAWLPGLRGGNRDGRAAREGRRWSPQGPSAQRCRLPRWGCPHQDLGVWGGSRGAQNRLCSCGSSQHPLPKVAKPLYGDHRAPAGPTGVAPGFVICGSARPAGVQS